MGFSSTITAVLMVVLLVAGSRVAEGQQNRCVAQLVVCANDLGNTTTPSRDCCSAISQVVTTQLSCLCALINNPSALGGINMTQALDIPRRCNIPADTSVCRASAPPPGASVNPPPATAGGGNGNSGSSRIWWVGMPTLLFLWALTFF